MKFKNKEIKIIEEKEMSYLSEKQQLHFNSIFDNFESYFYCEINGILYHRKRVGVAIAINELLGKIISKYFGDKQLKSEIINNENNLHYLLTKCFFEDDYLYSKFNQKIFPELDFKYEIRINLNTIETLNNYNFKESKIKINEQDLGKLKYRFKMMVINDFLRKQSDRWYNNFLIGYNHQHCKLMPLYDFEHSFFKYDNELYNTFILDFNDLNTLKYIREDKDFQSLLHLALSLDMKLIFEKLLDTHPIIVSKEEQEKFTKIINEQKSKIKKLIK